MFVNDSRFDDVKRIRIAYSRCSLERKRQTAVGCLELEKAILVFVSRYNVENFKNGASDVSNPFKLDIFVTW